MTANQQVSFMANKCSTHNEVVCKQQQTPSEPECTSTANHKQSGTREKRIEFALLIMTQLDADRQTHPALSSTIGTSYRKETPANYNPRAQPQSRELLRGNGI